MKVLLGCEESQAVTIEFRKLGFEAYSCDLEPCSGGHPEWHLQMDIFEAITACKRSLSLGFDRIALKYQSNWDLIIAFPPCTDLAVSGARWFPEKRANGSQQKSIDIFLDFTFLECMWAIENPIGIMSTHYRKPDQIIQPWQFGHGETKATCLWLKGLPLLKPTDFVEGREQKVWKMPPSADRAKLRSKTYSGIAAAMAQQWGSFLKQQSTTWP